MVKISEVGTLAPKKVEADHPYGGSNGAGLAAAKRPGGGLNLGFARN
jgi:hypothetical protein